MNNETIKIELNKADIISRLFIIQNVAFLAANCPEEKADIYILQGAMEGIDGLIQALIDDIGD